MTTDSRNLASTTGATSVTLSPFGQYGSPLEEAVCALYAKINAVGSLIRAIGKTGKNTSQNYKFAPDEAITAEIIERARENELSVTFTFCETKHEHVPRYKDNGQPTSPTRSCSLTAIIQVTDLTTGMKHLAHFPGYGEDVGDKAVYKAQTGAKKYALLQTFGIATSDDPEKYHDDPDPLNTGKTDTLEDSLKRVAELRESAFLTLQRERVDELFRVAAKMAAPDVRYSDLKVQHYQRLIPIYQSLLKKEDHP